MAATIHPTAIVEDGAKLGDGCVIEAFAYVGADVTLGENCIVRHHATVEGLVIAGTGNEIFPYALIGGKTHDLKYKGGTTGLRIGDNNVFREYTSVHPATDDGDFTIIGNNNNLLAYTHIAHDCVLGDNIIMSGHSALAGHVVVGDFAVIAWGCGVHQFCRIGEHCMVAAMTRIVRDVPPYMTVEGSPPEVRAINKIGLERRGFTPEQIAAVSKMLKIIYRGGNNRTQALEKIAADPALSQTAEGKKVIEFYRATARGVI